MFQSKTSRGRVIELILSIREKKRNEKAKHAEWTEILAWSWSSQSGSRRGIFLGSGTHATTLPSLAPAHGHQPVYTVIINVEQGEDARVKRWNASTILCEKRQKFTSVWRKERRECVSLLSSRISTLCRVSIVSFFSKRPLYSLARWSLNLPVTFHLCNPSGNGEKSGDTLRKHDVKRHCLKSLNEKKNNRKKRRSLNIVPPRAVRMADECHLAAAWVARALEGGDAHGAGLSHSARGGESGIHFACADVSATVLPLRRCDCHCQLSFLT